MNSAQTICKKAQDELDALALYDLYNNNESNDEVQYEALKKLKGKRKFRPIWSTMCSLQHNQSAITRIENDIHSNIGQKMVRVKGKSYKVTLYFLPISFSIPPHIENLTSLNETNGSANSIEIMAALPNQTCNEIAETTKKHIRLKSDEKINILSGLIDRNLLTEYTGLEFINGLTNRIADYEKDQTKDEAIVKWLAKYDAMESLSLSLMQPEEHRVLVLYTLTEVSNNAVFEKLQSLSCLVNNYCGSVLQKNNYSLTKELHEIINKTYQQAVSKYNGSISIAYSALPLQTFAFLRLSYFSNTLVNIINLSKSLWGEISECNVRSLAISDYLSKLVVSIKCVDRSGEFSMSHIYEPSYRYRSDDEISYHVDVAKHITKVNISYNVE